jgi:hypothetical protein
VVSRNPVSKIRHLDVKAATKAAAANRVVSTAANRVNRIGKLST